MRPLRSLISEKEISYVLITTGVGICLIGGDVELGSCFNRNIGVTDGITSTDLGTLSVESDSKRATRLDASSLTRVIDNRLVVLQQC